MIMLASGPMKPRRLDHLGLIYFFSDVLAIVCAYYTTLWIRFESNWGEHLFTWVNQLLGVRETGVVGSDFQTFYADSAPRIIFLMALVVGTLYALWDLYAERRYLKRQPVAWNLIVCNVMALAIFYTYFYLQRNNFHPRSMFATILALNTLYAVGLRVAVESVLRRLRERHGYDRRPVILIGRNRDADRILDLIAASPFRSLFLAEQLDLDPIETLVARIRAAVQRHAADTAILADTRFSIGHIMQFLELADELDISVKVLSREFDVLMARAKVEGDLIHGVPLVHFSAPSHARLFQPIKRVGSSILASLGLVVLSPVLAITALLVRLTSPGPVFFVQERMGVNRKPFAMWKFRTMVDRAEQALADMESRNESGQGLFKIRNDPRITRVGGFLRRYSIDELPQLLNVVRGDMTLVGPRPLPRRDFANYYEDWHYGRHNGLPGLTCLWQVSGRSELDFHSMCILDVYYLRNESVVLDLKILMRTVWVVLFAKGAY